MSNQGYGRNPADYGPLPGHEGGYGQAAYPDQAAAYPDQAAAYGGQDAGYGQAGYAPQGGYSTQGMEYEQAATAHTPSSHASANASGKGFIGSLFDFGFTSFVTPKIVKVLYVLIMAALTLVELGYLIFAFKESAAFGIISLVILCPLSFFVYLAMWRILLELFVVIFRISDDLRSIRERGES